MPVFQVWKQVKAQQTEVGGRAVTMGDSMRMIAIKGEGSEYAE